MQYFVSPKGLDTNPGTQAQPFLTIQAAANVAKAGDTVTIRAGLYRETVKPLNDGVTFSPMSGESVTITGTDPLNGWTQIPGSQVYVSPMGSSLGVGADQVFVNGQMWPEARWPKAGSDLSRPIKASIGSIVSVSQTQVVFKDPSITQPDGTWNGATMHIIPGEGWVCTYGTVVSQVGNQLTVNWQCPDTGAFAQTFEWPRAGNKYFLYNTAAAFTQAGEWDVDPAAKVLRLWMSAGQSPAGVEVKRRKYGFDLSGRKSTTIAGLHFFACTIQTDDNSANDQFMGITASYLSHYTYYSGWEAQNDSGIVLRGNGNSLSSSDLKFSAGDGVTAFGSNISVTNNRISDVNYCAADGAGIRFEWGSSMNAGYNLITNAGRDGIKFSACTKSHINYNRIVSTMLQTTDGGGLYAYGTDSQGTEVDHNIVSDTHGGGFGGAGVYLDNKSNGYYVHHNLSFDCDHGAKNNSPNTNTLWDKNTFIGTKRAVDADTTVGFTGTVYSNNVYQGPGGAALGNEAQKVNNYGPDPNMFIAAPKGVGAFADGQFSAGPVTMLPQCTPAGSPINALTYAGVFGSIKPVGGGQVPDSIGYCNANTWAKYAAVDFTAGCSKWVGQVGLNNAYAGGAMELHLDAPDGPLIGTFHPTGTGPNWTDWYTYQQQSCPVSGVLGVRDLYLVFKNDGTCNIKSFYFA